MQNVRSAATTQSFSFIKMDGTLWGQETNYNGTLGDRTRGTGRIYPIEIMQLFPRLSTHGCS